MMKIVSINHLYLKKKKKLSIIIDITHLNLPIKSGLPFFIFFYFGERQSGLPPPQKQKRKKKSGLP